MKVTARSSMNASDFLHYANSHQLRFSQEAQVTGAAHTEGVNSCLI